MDEQQMYSRPYDPVNTPIMDPQRQLPAQTSQFGVSTVAPVAMLAAGLAGAAAFLLTRRKKPTLRERLMGTLEAGYEEAGDFTKDEIAPRAETAAKKGYKLFKAAQKAAGKAADQAYHAAKHFAKHEGNDLAKQARSTGKHLGEDAARLSKDAAKTAKKGRSAAVDVYESMEAKYPILTGLLVAALVSEGQKLFESYRTRNA